MPTTTARTTLAAAAALAVVAAATPASALEAGDWLLRLRGIALEPQDDSSGIDPDLTTARVGVDAAVVPELDITYMVTDNVGLELIAATSPHDLEGKATLSGLGNIGDAWVLPPTLTLQYHFLSKGKVRPYLGAGINYSIFYNEDADASLEAVLGPTDVRLDDSFGYAVQAGVDIDVADNWFVNLDIKYVDITTTATLTSPGAVRKVGVDINPVIFGFGLGYRF